VRRRSASASVQLPPRKATPDRAAILAHIFYWRGSPQIGPVFTPVFTDRARVAFERFIRPRVEVELAFVLDQR